jgi:hypothetical protein
MHVRGPGGWLDPAEAERIDRLLRPVGDSPPLQALAGVDVVARRFEAPDGSRGVELLSARGISRVLKRVNVDGSEYRYEVVTADALGDWADVGLAAMINAGWHDASEWLLATVNSPYPDAVVQAAEMFESPRAGDLVVFAADGWDFRPGSRGSHGGIGASDMRIPMIFVGPGIPKGGTLPAARIVDVAPTILHFIRGSGVEDSDADFDGTDLAPLLLGAEAVQRPAGTPSDVQ